MTTRRVSDSSWTTSERVEVIHAFMERAIRSLEGPIFEYGDGVKNPTGGTQIKVSLKPINPALQSQEDRARGVPPVMWSFRYPKFSVERYIVDITNLRPFILEEQDIFLPKVVAQLTKLAKPECQNITDSLHAYISKRVDFHKPFGPDFFSVFHSSRDAGQTSSNSSELALNYIYGFLIKEDIDKREFIKAISERDDTSLDFAIVGFIQELMRIVYKTKEAVIHMDEGSCFQEKLLSSTN